MLDQQFFNAEKYAKFIENNFIFVHATRGEKAGDAMYKEYGIRATPTVLIADVDGSEIDRIVGYSPPADDYLDRIKNAMNGENTFKNIKNEYDKNPDDLLLSFKLAYKYDRMYKTNEAVKLYDTVLSRKEEAAKLELPYQFTEKPINVLEWAMYQYGYAKTRSGGIDDLRKFVDKYPQSRLAGGARNRIASYYAYSFKGDTKVPLRYFTSALEKNPANSNLMNYYVTFCSRKKVNIEDAVTVAEKMVEIEGKGNPYHFHTYGEILKAAGKEDKAKEIYDKSYPAGRKTAFAYALYDYANFWSGQEENLEDAAEMAMLAAKLLPERGYYMQKAAELLMKNDDEQKALEIYGPEYIAGRQNKRGDIPSYVMFWTKNGQNLDSAEEMARYYKDSVEEKMGRRLLAGVLMKTGREDEALELFGPGFVKTIEKEAIQLYFYANFWTEYEKNLQSALDAALKAVELSRQYYVYEVTAGVYEKLAQYDKAVEYLQKAMEKSPLSKDRYREKISELKKKI